MWACVTQGFPLVGLPGANVFFTDHDASTPPLPDGTRDVTCKQVLSAKAAYEIAKAARYIVRGLEAIGEL